MLSKEQARRWIEQRAKERKPLPSQSELRRQLGMALIEAERNAQNNHQRSKAALENTAFLSSD